MDDFKKCKMCQTPLNSETVSQSDPELCFECAEEPRKFTPEENQASPEGSTPTLEAPSSEPKKAWWKFW